MTTKWPHFVKTWEPKVTRWPREPSQVETTELTFHEALIAILDKREVTEKNISVLERNLCRINVQKILDSERERLCLENESMHENTLHRKVLDIKSRIIESFTILDIPFALWISSGWKDVVGDTRIIDVNHNMIRGLREHLRKST